jgi:hypothetical protein
MSEKLAIGATKEVVTQTGRALEQTVRKAWSIMDAASEKQAPSRYLSDRAMSSIQGKE